MRRRHNSLIFIIALQGNRLLMEMPLETHRHACCDNGLSDKLVQLQFINNFEFQAGESSHYGKR